MRIIIYKGTHEHPKVLYDTGKGSGSTYAFPCEAILEGNFKVHVEHKPGFFKSKQKLFELWHNTLFVDRNATIVDFMSDQLDIKRKLLPQLGEKLCLRLKFSRERPADSATAGSGARAGYEMVSHKEEAAEVANNRK